MNKSFFIGLFAYVGFASAAAYSSGKIVGGFQIDIAEVPYQVSLQRSGYHFCGGSIIGTQWVLTAAHCVDGNQNPSAYSVRIGSSSHSGGGISIKVRSVISHPDYDGDSYNYDFALLELAESIKYSRLIQQVDLPEAGAEVPDGSMCTVSGWGDTKEWLESSDLLRAVNVPSYNQEACRKALIKVAPVTDQMICAGYAAGGKDSCQGDSGGPLVADGKLIGVVSWGKGCALPNLPGVYARVSTVRSWISDVANI